MGHVGKMAWGHENSRPGRARTGGCDLVQREADAGVGDNKGHLFENGVMLVGWCGLGKGVCATQKPAACCA